MSLTRAAVVAYAGLSRKAEASVLARHARAEVDGRLTQRIGPSAAARTLEPVDDGLTSATVQAGRTLTKVNLSLTIGAGEAGQTGANIAAERLTAHALARHARIGGTVVDEALAVGARVAHGARAPGRQTALNAQRTVQTVATGAQVNERLTSDAREAGCALARVHAGSRHSTRASILTRRTNAQIDGLLALHSSVAVNACARVRCDIVVAEAIQTWIAGARRILYLAPGARVAIGTHAREVGIVRLRRANASVDAWLAIARLIIAARDASIRIGAVAFPGV